MNLRLTLAATALAALAASSAQAANIFVQNFSSGLSANESVSGRFSVRDGKMGHVDGYRNSETSYYDLTLDLTNVSDALMAFDYTMDSEWAYDGLNILASTDGAFDLSDLLMPTTSDFYDRMSNGLIGSTGLSGQKSGSAAFDLTQFAGQTVNLRFQFRSDWYAYKGGFLMDDLAVTGTPIPGSGAVPEPATWAMMILGFGGAGAAIRRRRRLAFA